MNKEKLFKILGLFIVGFIILFLALFVFPNSARAGVFDDYSMGPKPFGGKISIFVSPSACVFKKIKVSGLMPIEAYIVDFGPIMSAIESVEKIPIVGKGLAAPIRALLELLSPTKIFKYGPIRFFEWALGNTHSKTFSIPFLEGLKLIPPPFNVPFLPCDSNTPIIKFIGTNQNISF